MLLFVLVRFCKLSILSCVKNLLEIVEQLIGEKRSLVVVGISAAVSSDEHDVVSGKKVLINHDVVGLRSHTEIPFAA